MYVFTFAGQRKHMPLQYRIKDTVARQYRTRVNDASASAGQIATPKEGWVATVRKALGMSGAQLGRLMRVTRARVSQAEQAEISGAITLKSLQAMAEAMGCRLVYAIVPKDGSVEELIKAQAEKKAREIVMRAGVHMALEQQNLSDAQMRAEVERLKAQFLQKPPADFWNEEP